MRPARQLHVHELLSGRRRGPIASTLRGALWLAEGPYAWMMSVRNRLYDAGIIDARRLPRPVISVGNLTTGGTGKTPVVAWLAGVLRQRGWRAAVLMRGYRPGAGQFSDEACWLEESGGTSAGGPLVVETGGDRLAGAGRALARAPNTNVFILDDAMQHRRAARDFELTLVDAAEPFGFGHVLPRGLLREPASGLRRADAVVVTGCEAWVDAVAQPGNSVSADQAMARLADQIARLAPGVPIYRMARKLTGFSGIDDVLHPMTELAKSPYLAACGIGNPASFLRGLHQTIGPAAASFAFADHHDFSESDLSDLRIRARQCSATIALVTSKDWVKLRRLPGLATASATDIPIAQVHMAIEWLDDPGPMIGAITERLASVSFARGGGMGGGTNGGGGSGGTSASGTDSRTNP
jgi:tetraacyldisaccharide 4'-kinase